jgi:hypothetical protein
MSALEREIIERLHNMDEVHQKSVLEFIRNIESPKMDLGEWLEKASKIHDDLVNEYGKDHFFNSQSVLDEIREERLDDLMGGS